MRRAAVTAMGLTTAAVLLAVVAFGPAVLLVGAPLLLGTVLVFALIRLTEAPRRRLRSRRAARWAAQTGRGSAAEPGGLMSGFFEVSR